MSHVATIKTVILDLDALERAAENLGLKLVRGQTTHRWYQNWVNDYHAEDAAYHHGIDTGKCLHAITIPGNTQAYEIGVVKNPKGEGYVLLFDFWQGGFGMGDIVGGKEMGKLVAQYAKEVEIAAAREHGYSVSESVDEYGNIVLELEDGLRVLPLDNDCELLDDGLEVLLDD